MRTHFTLVSLFPLQHVKVSTVQISIPFQPPFGTPLLLRAASAGFLLLLSVLWHHSVSRLLLFEN